ncbi:MAG: tetratricopeptide repeat protein [Nitrospirales bacterium]
MRWATVPLALVVVLVAAPVWADFKAGVEAYKRGDYATALKEWRPLAEQGSPSAQFYMGVMLHLGYGLPEDDAEAARWYRRAAEQGHPGAQHNLGLMYSKGPAS